MGDVCSASVTEICQTQTLTPAWLRKAPSHAHAGSHPHITCASCPCSQFNSPYVLKAKTLLGAHLLRIDMALLPHPAHSHTSILHTISCFIYSAIHTQHSYIACFSVLAVQLPLRAQGQDAALGPHAPHR